MIRLLYLFILLVILFPPSHAQTGYITRHWNTSDGLEDPNCLYITIGPNEKLWIVHGMVEKASVLDGYSFSYIPNPGPNIPVKFAQDGSLWCVNLLIEYEFIFSGFKQLISNQWKSYTFDHLDFVNLSGYIDFFPLSKTEILIISETSLFICNIKTNKFDKLLDFQETELKHINRFTQSKNGEFWIGGRTGLAKLTLKHTKEAITPELKYYLFPEDLRVYDFFQMFDKNGEIIILTYSHDTDQQILICFDGKEWKKLYTNDTGIIESVWPGLNESYWMGKTDSKGKNVILNSQCLYEDVEITKFPRYVLSQHKGCFFIASARGLYRYSPATWRPPNFIPNNFDSANIGIGMLCEDVNGIQYLYSGLELLYLKENQWKKFSIPEYSRSFNSVSFCSLSNGNVYFPIIFENKSMIGSFHGNFSNFDTVKHPLNRDIVLFKQKDDQMLWVVTAELTDPLKNQHDLFLEIFDGSTFEMIKHLKDIQAVNLENVRDIIIRENGDIFVASWDYEGIKCYLDREYRVFNKQNGLPDTIWLSLLECDDGTLWAGGRRSIYSWDGQTWTIVKSGFENVRSMIQSQDGSIWAASQNGLFRYYKNNWTEITEEDGLLSNNVCEVFENHEGQIWALTENGVCCYYPDADMDSPETFIDQDQNSFEVPPSGNARISFSGMDKWKFTEADRLYFSHRIDKGKWSPFTISTTANYSNLSSGQHIFEVRAMDRNWNVDNTPASFSFTVLLPWYKEPKFLLILTISFFLILFFAGYALNRHLHVKHSNKQLNLSNTQLNTINAELQEANAQLMQLDQMKSAFVSQASHDLRTPLTAIKSSLDNVIRGVGGGLNEKQSSVIGRALKSVDRLTHLINDVLDINRIESGREVLNKEEVLFNVLVKNTVLENQPAANQKNITISTTGLDQSFRLLIDPGKIERVVGELISNAIKYTPEGGCVEITLAQDNQHVTLKVKDSGIGMTEEECKKIWERFYRTDASKTIAKGSGLGLSIAKELVEMHRGRLQVESEITKGTIFILQIPKVNTP